MTNSTPSRKYGTEPQTHMLTKLVAESTHSPPTQMAMAKYGSNPSCRTFQERIPLLENPFTFSWVIWQLQWTAASSDKTRFLFISERLSLSPCTDMTGPIPVTKKIRRREVVLSNANKATMVALPVILHTVDGEHQLCFLSSQKGYRTN